MSINLASSFALSITFLINLPMLFATEEFSYTTGEKWDLKNIDKGDSLYLQGCSQDPDDYYKSPKQFPGALLEVANKVKAKKKSPYKRPFITVAQSNGTFANKKLRITLENFRDLSIKTDNGTEIFSRKISGATSLFEILHKDKVIGWGVGWHKSCGTYYKHADFTVFRVMLPVHKKTGDIGIYTDVGSYDFRHFARLNKTTSNAIFDRRRDQGLGGAATYHYYRPTFKIYDHDKGLKNAKTHADLLRLKADLTGYSSYLVFRWMMEVSDFDGGLAYFKTHGRKISSELKNEYPSWIAEKLPFEVTYEKCQDLVKADKATNGPKEALARLLKKCYPFETYVESEFSLKHGFKQSFGIDYF